MSDYQLAVDYGPRQKALTEALAMELDLPVVISDLGTICWATGFQGTNATMLSIEGHLVIFTDARYQEYTEELPGLQGVNMVIASRSDFTGSLTEHLDGANEVVFDSAGLTAAAFAAVSGHLPSARCRLVQLQSPWDLRRVKDNYEVSLMVDAANCANQAVVSVLQDTTLPISEKQLQRDLDAAMLKAGADRPGFRTMVSSGPNSAKAHARPTDRVISPDEPVIIDIGGEIGGYRSDMTRTVWWGQLSSEAQRLYDLSFEALSEVERYLAVGVPFSGVYAAVERVFDEAGMMHAVRHSAGHSVGIEIHESPILTKDAPGMMQSGTILAIEPALYVPGVGGVRLENLYRVTDEGTESLSTVPLNPRAYF